MTLASSESPQARLIFDRASRGEATVAVVILSVNADLRAISAALSIIEQDSTAEIVIVNTGSGSLKLLLPAALRSNISLVESARRQFVGAARNLGIAHSRAPIIAFLAADCLATPGWVHARVATHQDGHCMVASALRPKADENGRISSTSWACHLLTHYKRTPGTPLERADRFGVSYERSLFERHGYFNPNVRVSEDLEFSRACKQAGLIAAWSPAILTLHEYPRKIVEAAIDQFERGVLSVTYALEHDGKSLRSHAIHTAREVRKVLRLIRISRADLDFRYPQRVGVLLSLLSIALMAGIVTGSIRSWQRTSRSKMTYRYRKVLELLSPRSSSGYALGRRSVATDIGSEAGRLGSSEPGNPQK